MLTPRGARIVKGLPTLRTNIYRHVADLDVTGAYPNNQILQNASKYTNTRELIDIQGISEETRRLQGINLSGGRTNAIEFCHAMFKLPTLPQLLALVQQEMAANPM